MGYNIQKQFSCSVLWFQNWNNEERKSFGRVLLEHEQNTSNTLPSMVAHTSYNNTSNTLPILTNTMNRLMLNSNQGLLKVLCELLIAQIYFFLFKSYRHI